LSQARQSGLGQTGLPQLILTVTISHPSTTSTLPDTIGAALLEGELRLKCCPVLKPRRHAELLLEKALGLNRTELYLRAQEKLPATTTAEYQSLLKRREAGEPVQYIVGWTPFYGYKFLIGEGVFIPRFDTEVLVQRALEIISGRHCSPALELWNFGTLELLDLCCGCGAIGLTIAAELLNTHVTLADISETALEYTARNALALLVNNRIETVKWDALTEPPAEWAQRFDLIVANPPYIPLTDIPKLHPDVQREPHEALTDGGDGLTFYRRWVQTLAAIMKPGAHLLVELGDGSAGRVREIIATSFANLTVHCDLNGIERVLEGIKKC